MNTTLDDCLALTEHHVSENKPRRIVTALEAIPELDLGQLLSERFTLIRENLAAARQQLKKITEAAERTNCTEVLALLREETVECGHAD